MNELRERWQILCEQASVETDAAKLLALVEEINNLLGQKEQVALQRARNDNAGVKTSAA